MSLEAAGRPCGARDLAAQKTGRRGAAGGARGAPAGSNGRSCDDLRKPSHAGACAQRARAAAARLPSARLLTVC